MKIHYLLFFERKLDQKNIEEFFPLSLDILFILENKKNDIMNNSFF